MGTPNLGISKMLSFFQLKTNCAKTCDLFLCYDLPRHIIRPGFKAMSRGPGRLVEMSRVFVCL